MSTRVPLLALSLIMLSAGLVSCNHTTMTRHRAALAWESMDAERLHALLLTPEAVAVFKDLNIIVDRPETLEQPEQWEYDAQRGHYLRAQYPMHPEVLATSEYRAQLGFRTWRDYEVHGAAGYHWLVEERLKPRIEALQALHWQYPTNVEILNFYESEVMDLGIVAARYGERYDDALAETRAWRNAHSIAIHVAEGGRWKQLQPGLWQRTTVRVDAFGDEYVSERTQRGSQQRFIDEVLKPEHDYAQAMLARLGEREARRRGIYAKLRQAIRNYQQYS